MTDTYGSICGKCGQNMLDDDSDLTLDPETLRTVHVSCPPVQAPTAERLAEAAAVQLTDLLGRIRGEQSDAASEWEDSLSWPGESPSPEREAYERAWRENMRWSGSGLTCKCHMPCPFCAAGHWCCFVLVAALAELQDGGVCSECTRGALLYVQLRPNGGLRYELLQTVGPDLPAWLPKIRRTDDVTREMRTTDGSDEDYPSMAFVPSPFAKDGSVPRPGLDS